MERRKRLETAKNMKVRDAHARTTCLRFAKPRVHPGKNCRLGGGFCILIFGSMAFTFCFHDGG